MIPKPSQPHGSSSNIDDDSDTKIRGPQHNRSFHACQSHQCPCQQLQVVSFIAEEGVSLHGNVTRTRNIAAQQRRSGSKNIQIVETRPNTSVKKANNETYHSSDDDGPSCDIDSRNIYYNRATWRMYMRIREDRIMKKKQKQQEELQLVEKISTPASEPEREPQDEGYTQSQSSMNCTKSTNNDIDDENERDDRFQKSYNFTSLIPNHGNANANGNVASSANPYNALSETSSLTSSEEGVSDREGIFQLDF